MRRVKNTIARYNLIRGWGRRLAAVIGLIGVLLLGLVGFGDTEVHAASNYSPLTCHTQGATVTKKYFLYTDWCGDGNATKIYRCDRAGTSISNCRKIVEGKFLHANVLYHVWDSNYFWIFDSGSPRKSGNAWCYNLNGKKAADAKCGTIPYNHAAQIDASTYTYPQGFTKYGNYHLKGVSGPNQIAVLRDAKLEKVLKVGYNIEELEDVSVDGDTGEIYFTTSAGRAVKLYKYSGYKLPPVPTTLNKTVKSGKTTAAKTTVTKPVAAKSGSEKSDAAKSTTTTDAAKDTKTKAATSKSTTVETQERSNTTSGQAKSEATKTEATRTENAKTETKVDKPVTTETQVSQPVAAETKVSQPVAAETGTSQSATTETRASQPVAVTESRPAAENRPVTETPSSQVAVEEPNNQTSEEQNSQQPSSQPSQQTEAVTENEAEARGGIKTTFFGEIEDDDKGCGIYRVLDLVIDVLSIGIGIAAVVGISLSGITYMTAVGNPQKTTTAKRRIAEIVIGVALYALLYAVLNFLLPGGKLNPSDVCLAIG